MKPSLGRVVHYKVTKAQAEEINRRRRDFHGARTLADYADRGYIAHFGNGVRAGDVFAATIVKVWADDAVNLQVQLDGTDVYWATSVVQCEPLDDTPGTWIWPPRG